MIKSDDNAADATGATPTTDAPINQREPGQEMDTTPIAEDPAPSRDGGHTTVPSTAP